MEREQNRRDRGSAAAAAAAENNNVQNTELVRVIDETESRSAEGGRERDAPRRRDEYGRLQITSIEAAAAAVD